MNTHYNPRPERWPQVSLKGFFVLVTLVGIFLGWVSVQVKWIRDRHAALEWNSVSTSSPGDYLPDFVYLPPGTHVTLTTPWRAPWNLRIFGEPGYRRIYVSGYRIDQPSSYRLDDFRRLFPEAELKTYYPPPPVPFAPAAASPAQ